MDLKEITCPVCGRAFGPGAVCAVCLWDASADCEGYPTLYDASGADSAAVRKAQSRRRAAEAERAGIYLELGQLVFGGVSPEELRSVIAAAEPAEAVCRLLSSRRSAAVRPSSDGRRRNSVLRPRFWSELKTGRAGVEAIRFQNTLRDVPGDAPDLSEAKDGSVRGFLRKKDGRQTLVICAEGGVSAPESCESLFESFGSLRTIDFGGCFHTEDCTDMHRMFSGCSSLESLDLRGFDTSRVTTMRFMFNGCASLRSLDLSSFDTARVESMYGMFSGCSSLESLDLRGFDTARVETMFAMFYGCASLRSLDLSSFNTSRVRSMFAMFRNCASLESLDLSSFDTSQVTDMSLMFFGCTALKGPNTRHFVIRKDCGTEGMYSGAGQAAGKRR